MLIFHDPVTGQQFFGYSIALVGLTYYKLGPEKIQSLATDIRLHSAEYRQKNPARTKIIGIFAILAVVTWAFWIWDPVSGDYSSYVKTGGQ